MVAAARRFIDGEIHFSELVDPITLCEWWSRINGVHSEPHILAKRWQRLVDRTWNEYGQHSNPLTVDELRQELLRVHCPQCKGIIVVTPFPHANGANITCDCGLCSGSMRGL